MVDQSQWIDIDDVEWDDVPWTDEPKKTYSEAIQDLQDRLRERADVRLDWQGGRGPRGDARVVFTDGGGTPTHRVRFRSADQLAVFTHVLRSATPLPVHQGLWYPAEKLIMALVACDYDELVYAVARTMLPKVRRKGAVPDSPLGRDVHGLLASSGAFVSHETPADSTSRGRTMRLVLANDELETLYPRRFRTAPAVALMLEGFEATDTETAQQLLVKYGTSFLHEIVRATGTSLRLWTAVYPTRRHSSKTHVGRIRFPREGYDATPAELYAAASSPGRDPMEKYLKYYQVLEFYMLRAATLYTAAHTEKQKLRAIADMAITAAQLEGFLRGNDLLASLSDGNLIQAVQVLQADANSRPIPGLDYRPDVVARVYQIRCRIVHAKEGGGHASAEVIKPYSREARDLGADLQLIRFFTERAIHHWPTPLR